MSVSCGYANWVKPWNEDLFKSQDKSMQLLSLLIIICIGLMLRLNGLGAVGLYSDEKYTFQAALGILETGLPVLPSGMLYPRAMLQSYLMAGSVMVFGENEWAFRFPSVIAGTLSIPAAYYLGKRRLRPYLNLAFAASVALIPSFIEVSQMARMYGFLVLFVFVFLIAFSHWERTSSWKSLIFVLITAMVGLEIQPLAVFLLPVLCVPLLVSPSSKRLVQTCVAVITMFLMYKVLGDWVATNYAETVLYGNQNEARHIDPLERFVLLDLSSEGVIGILAISVLTVVALCWSAGSQICRIGRIQALFQADFLFLLLGSLLLGLSIAAAAMLSYLVSTVAIGVGAVFYIRGGGGRVAVFYICIVIAIIFISQSVHLLIQEHVTKLNDFVKYFISFPSPVPEIRFFSFFPLAIVLFGVLFTVDMLRFAKGMKLPFYILLFAFGVLAPLLVMGVVVWSVAPRFLIGVVTVFLFCMFLCVESYLQRLNKQKRGGRNLEGIVAVVTCLTFISPKAMSETLNRNYEYYPDHKGAAEYIINQNLKSSDIVIALDASIQTYFLGEVDYWLRHYQVSGYFSQDVDGRLIEIYTGTPVIFEAKGFECLITKEGRGDIYVIGSGETHDPATYDYILGKDIISLFKRYEANVVFVGRDNKTLIWKFNDSSNSAEYGENSIPEKTGVWLYENGEREAFRSGGEG